MRLKPFEYSQKKLIHIGRENNIIKKSIADIKLLTKADARSKGWISNPRDEIKDKAVFWEKDPIL